MLLVAVEEQQGDAVFVGHFAVKALYINNKMEHFGFKVVVLCTLQSLRKQTGL